jgi:branched-chain amino acid transport system substrate-binding protein
MIWNLNDKLMFSFIRCLTDNYLHIKSYLKLGGITLKRFLSILLAVILTLALSACNSKGSSGSSSDTIKIGGIFSVSGPASPLGKPELDTVKMMVAKVNKSGGINGKKIKLVAYDDKSDQNEAVLDTKKLIDEDHVIGIIGGSTSGNSLAMLPLVTKAKIPFLSLASSNQIWKDDSGKVRKWVFKYPQGNDLNVKNMLKYFESQSITKVAFLSSSNSYGSDGLKEFKNIATTQGIEIVDEQEFEDGVQDAKSMLTGVKKADPQAIVIWGTTQGAAVVTKNIRELGIDAPIFQQQGIASPEFIKIAGDAANGVMFPAAKLLVAEQLPDSNVQKKTILDYRNAFKEKYGYETSSFGGHAWDAFTMMKQAIKKVGTDPAKIRDYIENDINDFVGITGIYNFSPEDHNGLQPDSLVMIKIEDGKYKLMQ